MAQHVRAERARQAGLAAVGLEDFPESDAGQAAPLSGVDEQPWGRALADKGRTSLADVLRQPSGGLLANRDDALLVALAE
jgi:hypothetical protein